MSIESNRIDELNEQIKQYSLMQRELADRIDEISNNPTFLERRELIRQRDEFFFGEINDKNLFKRHKTSPGNQRKGYECVVRINILNDFLKDEDAKIAHIHDAIEVLEKKIQKLQEEVDDLEEQKKNGYSSSRPSKNIKLTSSGAAPAPAKTAPTPSKKNDTVIYTGRDWDLTETELVPAVIKQLEIDAENLFLSYQHVTPSRENELILNTWFCRTVLMEITAKISQDEEKMAVYTSLHDRLRESGSWRLQVLSCAMSAAFITVLGSAFGLGKTMTVTEAVNTSQSTKNPSTPEENDFVFAAEVAVVLATNPMKKLIQEAAGM